MSERRHWRNRSSAKQRRRERAAEREARRGLLSDAEQRQIVVNRPGESARELARLDTRIGDDA